MNKYEIMFIVKPDLEETAIKKEADSLKKVLTNLEAKFVEEKAMGQRELAYEIKKYKNGYYFNYCLENSDFNENDQMQKLFLICDKLEEKYERDIRIV